MPKVDNIAELDMTRLAIIGCAGSGKSTLGSMLADKLGRPCIHLDTVMWNANWQLPSREERTEIHNNLIAEDSWIIEGSWHHHMADRLERATAIIWLDYSTSVCMRGILGRCIRNMGKQVPYLAEGCIETFNPSFIKYTQRYRKDRRPDVMALLALYADKVVTFTRRKQSQQWLDSQGK